MLSLVLAVILSVFPYKQMANDIERLCIGGSYFLINWHSSPLTICEHFPHGRPFCFMMNPFDTELRFGDCPLRIFDGNFWYLDMPKCWPK